MLRSCNLVCALLNQCDAEADFHGAGVQSGATEVSKSSHA